MKEVLKEVLIIVVTVLSITFVAITCAIGIFTLISGLPISQNENIVESDSIVHCINPLTVYNTNDDRIIYDKSTKVMYISRGAGCAYTPMYNADGTLRIWDGE